MTVPVKNRFEHLQDTQQNNGEAEKEETPTHDSQHLPEIPETESDSQSSNILILSDSMMKGIIVKKLSTKSYIRKEYVRGGTTEMINYIADFKDEKEYNQVVIHTGTNDIFKKSLDEINQNIEQIAQKCKVNWPNATLTLSGIIFHKYNNAKNDIIDAVNSVTQMLCKREDSNNVNFMDNDHITTMKDGSIDKEAFYDNLHLNSNKGMRKLAANLKKNLGLQRREPRNDRRVTSQSGNDFSGRYGPRRNSRRVMPRQAGSGSDYETNFQRFNEDNYRGPRRNQNREKSRQWNTAGFPADFPAHQGFWKALKPLAEWISTL